jgi:hypothetical protein
MIVDEVLMSSSPGDAGAGGVRARVTRGADVVGARGADAVGIGGTNDAGRGLERGRPFVGCARSGGASC